MLDSILLDNFKINKSLSYKDTYYLNNELGHTYAFYATF